MSHWITVRRATLGVAAGLLVVAVVAAPSAEAAKRKLKGPGNIARLDAPLGIQGLNGAGSLVVIPFTIVDQRPRNHRVEAEWAFDRNGDGEITSDEFEPASLSALDGRNTGRVRRARSRFPRVTYKSATGVGASHAFVWDSLADAPDQRFVVLDLLRDETGREMFDGAGPNSGVPGPGVQLRMRLRQGRGPRARGPFETTTSFSLDNSTRPGIRLLAGTNGDPESFAWEALSDVSRPLAVHFDYLWADPAFDLSPAGADNLRFLPWRPCTPATGSGDGVTNLASSPEGTPHAFAWDAAADVSDRSAEYVIRARSYDPETGVLSMWAYRLVPFTLAD